MRQFLLVLIAGTVLGTTSYLFTRRFPHDPAAEAKRQTEVDQVAEDNATGLQTARYDGHLFVLTNSYQNGSKGICHHPGCPCLLPNAPLEK